MFPSSDFDPCCANDNRGGDVKGVTSSGHILISNIETSLGQLRKLIEVFLISNVSIYTGMFPRMDDSIGCQASQNKAILSVPREGGVNLQ